ncbi:MAG: glycoside-pentoside-hexuronide (GPH):cation symporter [Bacteroidota bacterium]
MSQSLSPRTGLAYGVGSFGLNVVFQAAGFYLFNFLTDVMQVGAAFVGTLFLLARFWDAANDPLMGFLAQRTRTRWGSYRPYVLWGAVPLFLTFALLFFVPEVGMGGKMAYVAALYVLFGMAFTLVNVPFATLTVVLSPDYQVRGKLTGYRMTFAMLGGLMGATCFLPLVEFFGGGQKAWFLAALVLGMAVLIASGLSFVGTNEPQSAAPPQESPWKSFGPAWQTLKHNRPFWLVCLMFASAFAALGVFSNSLAYYFDYYHGDKSLTSFALLLMMGTTALFVPVWTLLADRIGKKESLLIGIPFSLLAFGALFFVPQQSPGWVYALLVVHGIGNAAAVYGSWALIPDTVEYGQWKSGSDQQQAGLQYGIYGFCFKLALGLGGLLTGWALAWVNYEVQPDQPDSVLQMLRSLVSLFPMGFLLLAWLTTWRYPIDRKLHAQIREELERSETVP